MFLGFYFFTKQKKIVEAPINTQQDSSQSNKVANIDTKEFKLDNMVLNIPKDLEVSMLNNNSLSIKIPGVYAENNDAFKKIQIKNKSIEFFYYKNDNNENKSLKEWFMYKGPQSEKGAQIAIEEKYIKLNTFDAYLTIYGVPDYTFDTKYYNREQTYLSNKTDIYEILNYRMANVNEVKLTPDELKSIQNYEKIVDQIIQSIHFVN